MSGECRACGAYYAGKWCQACGEGKPAKGKMSADEAAELANRQLEARRIFAAEAPGSESLTDQQWYNVCKFHPTIAARCRRPMVQVGPNQSLDRTSSRGPMFVAADKSTREFVERQPGEDDE